MRTSCNTVARGLAAGLIILALVQPPADVAATVEVPNDDRAIAHALNRLAFGGRPGDVARIKEVGLARWIDQQLDPGRIADPEMEARLARLTTLTLDPEALAQDFRAMRQERQRRQREAGQNAQPPEPGAMTPEMQRPRQVFAEMAEAKMLRAVYSERQLEEVLVDFWFNHFNVFARKGRTEIYIGEYERDAIRPRVLSSFRDLLGATAKSPAMLFYLDNWMSADPEAASRVEANRQRSRARGARPANQRQPMRMRGLNENYARELLELHTLGVDGGYTQQDVVAVARAFTGWTIGQPGSGGFRFASTMHDRGEKKILGHTIPAGGGIEDGERVLDLISNHPSTARHIAFKLAQRFVSDTPPPSVVDRAAATFQRTKGDLRAVVRTIVTSPEFFAADAYRSKVKTPFEFVASTLRATDAEVRSAIGAVRALQGLGMPPYLCQPPTGYDETAETWVSSGALVNRMNFALAVAGGQLRGIEISSLAVGGTDRARDRIVRDALGGDVSKATLDTIVKATSAEQTIALAIGSPEFQRQ
jgi:uncharacterized protein (DUF1800 family)